MLRSPLDDLFLGMLQRAKTTSLTGLMCGLMVANSVAFSIGPSAHAKILQGNVSKNDSVMRLSRPSDGDLPGNGEGPPVAPPRQLYGRNAMVDNSGFNNPFKGQVAAEDKIASPSDFSSPTNFDLGAEQNSRELKLAWERWHKQMSGAIYSRWQSVADEPGAATLRITVTRDRVITVTVLRASGSSRFDNKLLHVIDGLQGDPGLTFPSKSERRMVSFEADYVAARNVKPGFSWVKDDYETVRQNY